MKTLVINLARSHKRWDNFMASNSHVLSNIERVEAIDGASMGDKWHYLAPLIKIVHEPNKFNIRAMSACFMSHVKCARIIVERKLPYALVCEDDAKALPEVEIFLREYERKPLPFDWIRLHTHRKGQRDKHDSPVGLDLAGIDMVVNMAGAKSNAAYILTNAGACKVIGMQRMIAPPDYLEWHHGTQGVVFVQTRRNLFRVAGELASDISPDRGNTGRRLPEMIRVALVRMIVGRTMLRSNLADARAMAQEFAD